MTYKIKQSSPFLFSITMMIVFFSGAAILIFLSANQILPKGQPVAFILCFAPIAGLAFYLPRFTATADVEITIDNDGIKRKWLRQFILHNKPDNEFKWSEIEDYVFQPDRWLYQFKLHFKDGTKLKLYHNSDHEDDFRKFHSDFIEKVEQLNNADNDKRNDIKFGKTFYETTWGLVLAIIFVIIMVGFPIMLFVIPNKGKSNNYVMLGASYIGAIYYVIQVYTHRKKRKENENSFK